MGLRADLLAGSNHTDRRREELAKRGRNGTKDQFSGRVQSRGYLAGTQYTANIQRTNEGVPVEVGEL